ncbi:LptM family lipoprotein [Campylobacter taeniopygiae]|uniref:LptM family lipoprotein n=1 Tax=Campylobacter taeniopygiae TaxID=2510188 RepID=UPI003D6B7BB3
MKKILKGILALGLISFLAGCGGDSLTKAENKDNSPFFNPAIEKIKSKYPNCEIYDYTSIKNLSHVDSKIRNKIVQFYTMQSQEKPLSDYSKYFLIKTNENKYKIIGIDCYKEKKQFYKLCSC